MHRRRKGGKGNDRGWPDLCLLQMMAVGEIFANKSSDGLSPSLRSSYCWHRFGKSHVSSLFKKDDLKRCFRSVLGQHCTKTLSKPMVCDHEGAGLRQQPSARERPQESCDEQASGVEGEAQSEHDSTRKSPEDEVAGAATKDASPIPNKTGDSNSSSSSSSSSSSTSSSSSDSDSDVLVRTSPDVSRQPRKASDPQSAATPGKRKVAVLEQPKDMTRSFAYGLCRITPKFDKVTGEAFSYQMTCKHPNHGSNCTKSIQNSVSGGDDSSIHLLKCWQLLAPKAANKEGT